LALSTPPGKQFEDDMTKRLETVQSVIETLYGRGADMARELDRSRTAVWKYVHRDQLPGELYERIQQKAALNGYTVADGLFTPISIHPRLLNRIGE
jgi:hypothetical protein